MNKNLLITLVFSLLLSYLRLIKEVAYYEQEVKENEATLEEMKTANKDPYDIKKFKEVLSESYMMIPDSKSRLESAIRDLEEYMESPEATEIKDDDEWYLQAKDLLVTNTNTGRDINDDVQETDLGDLQQGEAF